MKTRLPLDGRREEDDVKGGYASEPGCLDGDAGTREKYGPRILCETTALIIATLVRLILP